MTDDEFWDIIAEVDLAGDATESLAATLAERSTDDAIEFDRVLYGLMRRAWSAELWQVAGLVTGEPADDTFEYFRLWLIFQGRQAFEAVTAQPDRLGELCPGSNGYDLEGPQYVAWSVYRARTGRTMPARRRPLGHLHQVWDLAPEADLARLYPRTWAKVTATAPSSLTS